MSTIKVEAKLAPKGFKKCYPNNWKGIVRRMVASSLLRKAYEQKKVPTRMNIYIGKKKIHGELEVFDSEVDFDTYIEAEIIHMWEEKYKHLWQNKDMHQV